MTLPRTRLPVPGRPADVHLGPAHDLVLKSAPGAQGAGLLRDVSVARTATVLVELLRDPQPAVRALLSGLEAFRQAQSGRRLAPVLARAWSEPGSAESALGAFAAAAPWADDDEVARLGFGPKLWFTTNGVPVTWRPLPASRSAPVTPHGLRLGDEDRRVAARDALRRLGFSPTESARLRLADLGRLVPGAVFVPDMLADPLAVRFVPDEGGPSRLTFLDHQARIAVLSSVLSRHGLDAGCRHPRDPVLIDVG
jgi:hypothetical protein